MSEFHPTEEDIRRAWDGPDAQADFEVDTSIGSRDLANSHDSNATLRNRDTVKEFYERIKKKKSELFRVHIPNEVESKSIWVAMQAQAEGRVYMDEQTLEWLGDLSFSMSTEAIPLFEDPETDTDYQLHPCYPQLPVGKNVPDPSLYLEYLYSGEDLYSKNAHVIPLGRLFINTKTKPDERGQISRLSKWTGYELYLGLGFQILLAFNRDSLAERQYGWYPVACRLLSQDTNHSISKDGVSPGTSTASGSSVDGSLLSTEPKIRMGCIGRIGSTDFEIATQQLKIWKADWDCLPMVDEVGEGVAKRRIREGDPIAGLELDRLMPRWQVSKCTEDITY